MSRLFGFMCNDPDRVACALQPVREALVAGEATNGWGMAFYQGGEVLLLRHPKAAPSLDFFTHAAQLRTDYLVGQVREVDLGNDVPRKLENTQPFRFRSWVFAASGVIEGFSPDAGLRAALLEHVPDFLIRNVRGQSDAEHLFHVFLAFLHDAGKLDDANIRIDDAAGALRAAVAAMDKLVAGAGKPASKINLVATNGRIMLAVRHGRPIWVRQTNGIADCKVCNEAEAPRDGREGRGERRRMAHDHLRAILMVSEPAKVPSEGFEEVPDASLISISRDLTRSLTALTP